MQPAPAALELALANEQATAALAAWLAARLEPGCRLYLSGDLGSGKTTFTRTLLNTLGHTGRVRSPTFTLMEPYNLPSFDLYHFDFYRFSSADEWREAGFDELVGSPTGVSVVEWPDMAGAALPAPDLRLAFQFDPDAAHDTGRRVRLQPGTGRGGAWLTDLQTAAGSGHLAGVSCVAD